MVTEASSAWVDGITIRVPYILNLEIPVLSTKKREVLGVA